MSDEDYDEMCAGNLSLMTSFRPQQKKTEQIKVVEIESQITPD
jgi:hypothetical protein